MEWADYKEAFIREASAKNKSKEYINSCLLYAKKLFENGVPIIYNLDHFSRLVGYQKKYVKAACCSSPDFYRCFTIKKKNGKERKISEPLPSLKEIQKWILNNILDKVDISKYAKAYAKGKSVKDNAKFHRNQKIVLSLDITDFFDNIHTKTIFDVFRSLGYSRKLSWQLAYLCCLNGSLPQGAPTSAALSNIILKEFDENIGEYTFARGIRYTRYADDMTFSGDFDVSEMIRTVVDNLKPYHLCLNRDKTRTRKPGQRQEVTGIVVNEKIQTSKSFRKEIRQEIYYIKKYGLDSHLDHLEIKKNHYLEHLIGKINYVLFINPKDEEFKEYMRFIKENVIK